MKVYKGDPPAQEILPHTQAAVTWEKYLAGIERDEQCKKLTLEQQVKLMKRYGYDWPVRQA
jgi:hypothetical protein